MKQYLLGADGGGTKTAVVLTDMELNTVCLQTFPRSNPGDIGYEQTEALLLHAFDEVCAQANVGKEEIAGVFAGIAGLSAGDCTPKLRAALQASFPNAKADCSHDGMNVLYAAFPDGSDGVAVICGTGSSCFAKKGNYLYRIGGCGQFDLKGNGFEIGRAAFAHLFRTLDGRDRPGVLARLLNDAFGGDAHAHIIEINSFTKDRFASFAPLVFRAAKEGDGAANALLCDQLHYVSELIATAGRLYGGNPYRVGLAGGIFRDELTLPIVKQVLPKQAELFRLQVEPYLGAAAKARAVFGGEPRLIGAFPQVND